MLEKLWKLRWPYSVLSVLVFAVALALCLPIPAEFPYHFTFDMDHTTTLDSLLMQSGKLPAHINHPGFGMYFLLAWAHRVAYWLGAVSALTFQDLSNALDPFLPMIELKLALRNMIPWMAAFTMWLLWYGATLGTKIPRLLQALLALIPVTLYPLLFLSSHIRSELFAVFYLALALAFLYDSVRPGLSNCQIRNRLLAAGAAVALAEFTKIQATVGILVVVAIYFYLVSERGTLVELFSQAARKRISWIIGTGWPLLLLVAAFKKAEGATFTDRYKINPLGCVFVLLPLLLLASEWERFRPRLKFLVEQRGFRDVLLCFFLGALGIMLLHFCFYLNPWVAFKLLLIDVKMVFERNNYNLVAWGGWLYLARSTINSILYQPGIFLANALLVGFVAWQLHHGLRRYLLLACGFLAYANIYLSVRMNIHDTIWTLTPITMVSLLCLRELLRNEGASLKLGAVLAVFLLGSQIREADRLIPLTRSAYQLYGFNYQREFEAVYGGQEPWPELMEVRYPAKEPQQRTSAVLQGQDLARLHSLAVTVVPNLKQTTLHLSSVRKGLPVLRSLREFRIVDFSPGLAEAALLDLEDISKVSRFTYDEEYVDLPQNAALLLRLAPNIEKPSVAILRRQDLELLWLSPPQSFIPDQFQRPADWTESPEFVKVMSGDSVVEFKAHRINKFQNIPLPGPKGGFLVIRRLNYDEFMKK